VEDELRLETQLIYLRKGFENWKNNSRKVTQSTTSSQSSASLDSMSTALLPLDLSSSLNVHRFGTQNCNPAKAPFSDTSQLHKRPIPSDPQPCQTLTPPKFSDSRSISEAKRFKLWSGLWKARPFQGLRALAWNVSYCKKPSNTRCHDESTTTSNILLSYTSL
jgi:hypothetical protein